MAVQVVQVGASSGCCPVQAVGCGSERCSNTHCVPARTHAGGCVNAAVQLSFSLHDVGTGSRTISKAVHNNLATPAPSHTSQGNSDALNAVHCLLAAVHTLKACITLLLLHGTSCDHQGATCH